MWTEFWCLREHPHWHVLQSGLLPEPREQRPSGNYQASCEGHSGLGCTAQRSSWSPCSAPHSGDFWLIATSNWQPGWSLGQFTQRGAWKSVSPMMSPLDPGMKTSLCECLGTMKYYKVIYFCFLKEIWRAAPSLQWKLMDKVLREVLEFAATVFHCLLRLGGQPWTWWVLVSVGGHA